MLDAAFSTPDIVEIALAGLSAQPKTLPPKLFYDAEGVRLFEAITRLPEYYVTRTERALLDRVAPEIVALAQPGSALVEYGASDEAKAMHLVDAQAGRIAAYVPIDVAGEALASLADRLQSTHPDLRVHPVCGDFLRPIALPQALSETQKFGFFPGSTIGNLEPQAARDFLSQARHTLGAGAWFIIGVDLRKSPDILIPAYDDAAGITAAFNLNLLHRLNREAAADFRPADFCHRAVWNEAEGRIEMHLESRIAQTIRIAGTQIAFAKGETIHTENSYKHSIEGFQSLAATAGWTPRHVWTDDNAMFSIHALSSGASQ